jgi:hypothetical protein
MEALIQMLFIPSPEMLAVVVIAIVAFEVWAWMVNKS